MTIPTNIPEAPMADTKHESIQGSKESSTSPRSMEVLHQIIYKVMHIKDDEEIQSFKHQMKDRGFETFKEMHNAFSYMLDNIHDHNEYKLDGSRFALKFGSMDKIRLLIKWVFIKNMTDKTFNSMLRTFWT